MGRDAAATRARILDAAIDEFSAYGIAGARVDRIAGSSSSNKSLIYAYYGNKHSLFDAVFDAVVVQTMNDVPIDATDLAEYAARLFDQHRRHPEPVRIGNWDQLERDGAGMKAPLVIAANHEKAEAISAAQSDGHVNDHIAADTLLEFILALSRTGVFDPLPPASTHRRAIKVAVSRLVGVTSAVVPGAPGTQARILSASPPRTRDTASS